MGKKEPPPAALTPVGRLDEADLFDVLGYQLSQAGLAADLIFETVSVSLGGMRKVEYAVLMLVARNPRVSPARIARALAVTPPHITAIVDRLVTRGLVTREVSALDRRGQNLVGTPAGNDLVRKTTDAITASERATFRLTHGEHAILVELLHKIARTRHASPPEVPTAAATGPATAQREQRGRKAPGNGRRSKGSKQAP